ncbi:hypothetical protein YPPY103_2093, partial [Yersinia pestis PY-103]
MCAYIGFVGNIL